ncbi:hypothetical protein SAMN06297251_10171 [Fulvimarina manganoxydans]|uniref:Uncharacterized protein n=1 Tax=Fulvimarina manganoxydans TaxID=937218 RepID=A0A1W1Y974_9HYPH|nr:hypothetical protein [Fulvimarina manganoxydans]SMC32689.1 hypothetical protein SAMN06297251_10171 [Fulvimarina manganoxydans]
MKTTSMSIAEFLDLDDEVERFLATDPDHHVIKRGMCTLTMPGSDEPLWKGTVRNVVISHEDPDREIRKEKEDGLKVTIFRRIS